MSVDSAHEGLLSASLDGPVGSKPADGVVLHVEDDLAHVEFVAALLEEQPEVDCALLHCSRLTDAIEHLDVRDDITCVLLDLNLPDAHSLSTLHTLLARRPAGPPVIVLTGSDDHATAQQALRMGAEDYLPKQELGGFQLARAITYAIERRHSRQERFERESFIRTVLDSLGAHTAVLDRAGVVTDVNESWRAFAADNGGTERTCGVGVNYLAVCDAAAARGIPGAAETANGIRAVLRGHLEHYEVDYECPSPQTQRWFTMEVDPLPGPRGGAVIFHVPITRLKQQAAALEHMALHDTLTGLPNRSYFSGQLDKALAGFTRDGGYLAVLVCDLDDFKIVNDSLGHQAGDEVLIEVASRLRSNVRAGDVVARLSGDEFVVLLHARSSTEMEAAARRLRDSLAHPVALSLGEEVRLGASIGGALATEHADASSLLRDADAAMYRAKELGRRRIHWFDDQLRDEVLERHALQRDLVNGLQQGELFCHYQPQLSLADGALFGFESLVRWQHPSQGTLSPARFVPIIERIGEAGALFDHVLRQTLTEAHQWEQRLGWQPAMSVNLSAQQLGDPSLLGSVEQALDTTRTPPSRLWLEVTETAVAEAASLKVFRQLRRLGVRLAIDDFGTGQSSMARLAGFEWDACKIDRSFVNAMDTGARSTSIIEAAIAMAHSLDMDVVAEGLETKKQLTRLSELGCDVAQGHLLARPAPADTFDDAVDRHGIWRDWHELQA